MTTFNHFTDRNRDMQDGIERHVYGAQEYTDAGAILRVRGTGTVDEEAVVLTQGYSFNLPQDYNTEVFLLAGGSDTTLKYALMSIPRDKQRRWGEGMGGIQHPTDPDNAIQFEDGLAWVTANKLLFGPNKEVTLSLSGGKLSIEFNGVVEVVSNELKHNNINVGSTHTHPGVERGPDSTEAPNP